METLHVGTQSYRYVSLKPFGDLTHLPYSLKVLLENVYRYARSHPVDESVFESIIHSQKPNATLKEIPFAPARVLMQDFTGVPAVVDLAAMRDAMKARGQNPEKVNPLIPVDLVIDHSVMVDFAADTNALSQNVALEYQRNRERYAFLRWGQKAFQNFRVVPPGMGICHQVNLEYLANVVWTRETENGETLVYPDTLVGTDSHTTMVNGLAVLGWGVGGIEAEAAMLGQPISMLVPQVVGVKLTGHLPEGTTATDLVLTLTNRLRAQGVVGKFVEFFGSGVAQLSLADRATLANMAPEYGATCGFFPIDEETLTYLRLTGREAHHIQLVEAYAKAQGLWNNPAAEPTFRDVLPLDLGTVTPSVAGPKRPQDRIELPHLKAAALSLAPHTAPRPVETQNFSLSNHDVVIAAITSCTNTSNPSVMVAAGLLARKARQRGLKAKPWVKTSLAPGSQAVTAYLEKAGLMDDLNAVGFYLVGYGCTTCIGNSGPLDTPIVHSIEAQDLTVAGVLSGNRNFEGRINPHVKANYLASPPLVVAFAIAGTTAINMQTDPLGEDAQGNPVYLKDIWPSSQEVQAVMARALTPDLFKTKYSQVFEGDAFWQGLATPEGTTFTWEESSTYIKHPPYFNGSQSHQPRAMTGARILAVLGDSITTDHISPAGSIKPSSPAGLYLTQRHVTPEDFNSYGARRGNHEIMMRGTFANIRLQNEMVPGTTGGFTCNPDLGKSPISIYDAAMAYRNEGTPLVVIAGKEYGTGSSRDWAAKGTSLLGVKTVIAESFERIHRSNLVGMGVLPLQFKEGENRKTLGITGREIISIPHLANLNPQCTLMVELTRPDGSCTSFEAICRMDTEEEIDYYTKGGILHFVLAQLSAS
jgi:aconitate hydratase